MVKLTVIIVKIHYSNINTAININITIWWIFCTKYIGGKYHQINYKKNVK